MVSRARTHTDDISALACATALIQLHNARGVQAASRRTALITRLLSYKQPSGVFHDETGRPADLHTASTVIGALHAADPALVGSDMIGAWARQLIAAEYAVGGPYRSQPDERSPDPSTNAIIADTARRLGAPLPNVERFLAQTRAPLPAQTVSSQSWRQQSRQRLSGDATAADYAAVVRTVRHDINELKEPLRSTGHAVLNKILRADERHEISLMPFAIANQLNAPAPTMHRDRLIALGTANVYNWIAYSIYDDFLDNEGEPGLLSIANVSLRAAVGYFQAGAPDSPEFQRYIVHVFNRIDTANAWETAHCRATLSGERITLGILPSYGDNALLAERSYSHALPAIGVLANSGIPPQAPEAMALRRAFKHYLIARQLNDDMHDWEEDVRNGQISPVVSDIMRSLSTDTGVHDFKTLLPRMKKQFWRHTLAKQNKAMGRHIRLSRLAVRRSKLLVKDNIITHLLDGLESSRTRTEHERERVASFMQGYTDTYIRD